MFLSHIQLLSDRGEDKREIQKENKEERGSKEGGTSETQLCIGYLKEKGWSFSIFLSSSIVRQSEQCKHTHTEAGITMLKQVKEQELRHTHKPSRTVRKQEDEESVRSEDWSSLQSGSQRTETVRHV